MDAIKHEKTIKIIGIILIILLLMNLIGYYKALHRTLQIPIPVVSVQKPQSIKMTEYITQTGTTVAFNAVNLVARVEGYLDTISFTDGTIVKKDQPLFVIEPEPYLEKLREAQASVAVQKAQYDYTKSEYARQQHMYKENATSLNNVEKWLAQSKETEAEIAKAVANERIAAINYSYTHIKAPFDGRIGRHLVDVGNLVGNGQATNLATIEQISPLYVYFNLNELDLIRLRNEARRRNIDHKKMTQIPVDVSLQYDNNFIYHGKLDFINTGLNASTGTMEFRALLPNADKALVPGLFVQVRVPLSDPALKLTVPETAILYDQIGAYLYTVDSNNKVVVKRVTLGSLEQNQRAILKGLDANDNVIVEGLQNATPGDQVAPQPAKKSGTAA